MMPPLESTLHAVRRRLNGQRLARLLPWGWTVAGGGVIVGWLVERSWSTGLSLGWKIGLLATLGTLGAMFVAWLRRCSLLDAAYALDRRCGLQERIATAWSLSEDERASDVGQALLADAQRQLERVEWSAHFPFTWNRWQALPVVPTLLAAWLWLVWPPVLPSSVGTPGESEGVTAEVIRQSTEPLKKHLEAQRAEAAERQLPEAEQLFAKLEAALDTPRVETGDQRREALVQLKDLAEQLAERQRALGVGDALQRPLAQLTSPQGSPLEKVAQALQRGDLGAAAEGMKQLGDQLQKGGLDDGARAELARQLDHWGEAIRQARAARQAVEERLAHDWDAARAAGRHAEAEQLERQREAMAKQAAQQAALDTLQQRMQGGANALRQDGGEAGADGLRDLAAELQQLQRQAEEGALVAEALDQLQQAREGLAGGQGGQPGQGQPGQGGPGEENQGGGQGPRGPGGAGGGEIGRAGGGQGIGQGRGPGFQETRQVDPRGYDSRVKSARLGTGGAQVVGFVEGSRTKGEVQQSIRTEWQAVEGAESDPLAEQALPQRYRESARRYFDALRTGETSP